MIDFDNLQKLSKNVEDLDKLIVAKGFKNLPKVQWIAQSGHNGTYTKLILLLLTKIVNILSYSCSQILCLEKLYNERF